jgi:outer membrane protein OmpA-like peptidoglycan-associated protein
MSVSSSDDASDTFWPGYVDAVTNLAINLLFVIAVMAIVVISSIMQMAKMTETPANLAHEKLQAKNQEVSDSKKLAELEKQLATTQAALKEALSKSTSQAQSASQSTQSTPSTQTQKQAANGGSAGNSGENTQEEVVQASEKKVKSSGNNSLEVSKKGIVVAFSSDVVELSDKEATELLTKMAALGTVKTAHWQVAVVSPKGFSEAIRLAYYRASAVRNVLLKNGVPPSAIDMRVVESASAGADNARVMVKLLP